MRKRLICFTTLSLAVCLTLLSPQPIQAQSAPLDHFDCYYPQSQPTQNVSVTLQDVDPFISPIPAESITGLTLIQFCNPVQKTLNGNTTPIAVPGDHLAMYALFPVQTLPAGDTPTTILISNQLAPRQLLRVSNPVILAVPTGKNEVEVTAGPPPIPAIPTDLDHFVCYLADGVPPGAIVQLKDQFDPASVFAVFSRSAQVERPLLFCDAVRKTVTTSAAGGGVVTNPPNPNQHLACYEMRPLPGLASFVPPATSGTVTVSINNQFVTPPFSLTLTRESAHILCVPSTLYPLSTP